MDHSNLSSESSSSTAVLSIIPSSTAATTTSPSLTVVSSLSSVSSVTATTTEKTVVPSHTSSGTPSGWINSYFKKWLGAGKPRTLTRPSWSEVWYSWLGSTLGILVLGLIHYLHPSNTMIIGSFGASAVLIYGVPQGPLSQPRNLVLGHVLSALVGVIIRELVVYLPSWTNGKIVAAALSVSCSITVMQLTSTLHPPGAASALIAVIGDKTIIDLGYMYILQPVLSGSLIMLIFAVLVNNLSQTRVYPQFWW